MTIDPVVLGPDQGEAFWFVGMLAIIKASGEATEGRVAVIDHLAPQGAGSPLHVHSREDEWFYVVEGALRFLVGDRRIEAPKGSFLYGPRGIPHSFMVTSPEARFLLGAEPAGFENFLRAVATPAKSLTIPPPASEPPDFARLAAVAAEYGIEILGPPGIPA